MVYKFRDISGLCEMEVELFKENPEEGIFEDVVEFKVQNIDTSDSISIWISKSDVFKLNGAMHITHKDMK